MPSDRFNYDQFNRESRGYDPDIAWRQSESALAPIEARLSEIRKKMEALGPKPECFGMRSDMDLPECDGCRFGALCFRAMKAKGLI